MVSYLDTVSLSNLRYGYLLNSHPTAGLMYSYINGEGHIVLAPLNMLPPPPDSELDITVKPAPITAPVPTIGTTPIPNPFKAFKPREVVKPIAKPLHRDGRLLVGTEKDLGACWDWAEADEEEEEVVGMRVCGEGLAGGEMLAVIWTSMRVLVSLLGLALERDLADSNVVKVHCMGAEQSEMKRWHEIPADDVLNVHAPSNKELIIMRKVSAINLRRDHIIKTTSNRAGLKLIEFVKPMRTEMVHPLCTRRSISKHISCLSIHTI